MEERIRPYQIEEKIRPYQRFKGQLILRDHLAADRTILANERTFLAYIRTALTLFVVGLSFVHLKDIFSSYIVEIIGIIFILIGITAFCVGLLRYHQMKIIIRKVKQKELAEGIKHEI